MQRAGRRTAQCDSDDDIFVPLQLRERPIDQVVPGPHYPKADLHEQLATLRQPSVHLTNELEQHLIVRVASEVPRADEVEALLDDAPKRVRMASPVAKVSAACGTVLRREADVLSPVPPRSAPCVACPRSTVGRRVR